MKVIDLLNKIANGEKVPKEIKVNDNIYYYDETDCNEFYRYMTMKNELLTDYADLNDEVEIIEDKARFQYSQIPSWFDIKELIKAVNENFEKHQKALNEIIDKINRE